MGISVAVLIAVDEDGYFWLVEKVWLVTGYKRPPLINKLLFIRYSWNLCWTCKECGILQIRGTH